MLGRRRSEALGSRRRRSGRAGSRRRRSGRARGAERSRAMSGPGLVAGEVAVDALPYFDQGYEAPGVREAVSAGADGGRGAEAGTGRGGADRVPVPAAGRGAGGGGDAALPAHQELPQLLDRARLQRLRGEPPSPPSSPPARPAQPPRPAVTACPPRRPTSCATSSSAWRRGSPSSCSA